MGWVPAPEALRFVTVVSLCPAQRIQYSPRPAEHILRAKMPARCERKFPRLHRAFLLPVILVTGKDCHDGPGGIQREGIDGGYL